MIKYCYNNLVLSGPQLNTYKVIQQENNITNVIFNERSSKLGDDDLQQKKKKNARQKKWKKIGSRTAFFWSILHSVCNGMSVLCK